MTGRHVWQALVLVLLAALTVSGKEECQFIGSADGRTWRLGATKNGVLSTTTVDHASPAPCRMNPNDGSTAHTFEIGAAADGGLTTTPKDYDASKPRSLKLNSGWWLSVTGSGKLVTSRKQTK
jgi:hypothetical protein